jgi:hypothetical protein
MAAANEGLAWTAAANELLMTMALAVASGADRKVRHYAANSLDKLRGLSAA